MHFYLILLFFWKWKVCATFDTATRSVKQKAIAAAGRYAQLKIDYAILVDKPLAWSSLTNLTEVEINDHNENFVSDKFEDFCKASEATLNSALEKFKVFAAANLDVDLELKDLNLNAAAKGKGDNNHDTTSYVKMIIPDSQRDREEDCRLGYYYV